VAKLLPLTIAKIAKPYCILTARFGGMFLLLVCLLPNSSAATSSKSTVQEQEQKQAPAKRIVSLSLCTDQLLLMLSDKANIAGLTYLAPDITYSDQWQKAEGIPVHHGLAEEITRLTPDLIIDSSHATGSAHAVLQQLGFEIKLFASPNNIEEIESLTRDFAKAIGHEAAAEPVLKQMQLELSEAKALTTGLEPKLAISYGPYGFTAGKHTLKHQVLNLAGYRNLAAEIGIEYYGNLSVEQLLTHNPDVIIHDESIGNTNSLAQRYVTHPALNQVYHGKKKPSVATRHWICPGPMMSKAVLSLAQQRLSP